MSNSDYPKLREFERLDERVTALDTKIDGLEKSVVRLETLLEAHVRSDAAIAPRIEAVHSQLQQSKKTLPWAGAATAIAGASLGQLFPKLEPLIQAIIHALGLGG